MPTTPAGVRADGALRIWSCTALGNVAAPSISTELNAGTTKEPALFMTGNLGLSVALARIADDRLALDVVLERKGTSTWSAEPIEYVYDPQTPAGATNALYVHLPENAIRYWVVRSGVAYDTAPTTSHRVNVFTLEFGPAVQMPTERNSMIRVRQEVLVIAKPSLDVALVA
jgi:hypothetical protein